jgi:ferredoxin
MKIALVFFSPTGSTALVAEHIRDYLLDCRAVPTLIDITPMAYRGESLDMAPYDALILGVPVHSWRAPRVVRNWISGLCGDGKPCSTFFTYGGFQIHPAHHSTRTLLENAGFRLVSSAEFPASHTFNLGGWKAMENRPDESDFAVAKEYAEKTSCRFSGEDRNLPGPFEPTTHTEAFLDEIEMFRFRILSSLPARKAKSCSLCGICQEICPTGAFDAQRGAASADMCIACLGCLLRCPEQAITIPDLSESFAFKLKAEGMTIDQMQTKESRIYF